MQSIRDVIRVRAKDKKLSPGELATLTGLNRSTIWRYFHGKADMTGENIDRLLHALKLRITSDDLFE